VPEPENVSGEYVGLHGEKLYNKPEILTHLYGNQLTEKDNPVIIFRGKLDMLCSMILEAQVIGREKENRAFVNDLQEILEFVRNLLPAEYNKSPIREIRLLGLSSREMREHSQHPEKYFGRDHLLMHHTMGALCIRLNMLRSAAREVELAAITAFRDLDSSKCGREDIVEALNRLSSLFYILIYKYLPKSYTPVGNAGI
jgi:ethanolamine utilization cobalamin adenosyltransferase